MSDKTVPMDMLLQIRMPNAENVSSVTKIVHAILDPLLRKCPTGKWVKMPTISPTSLDYLIRVQATVKYLRVKLRGALAKDGHTFKIRNDFILRECEDRHSALLNGSMYNHIVELTAPSSLPLRTHPVAEAATTPPSGQNLQVCDGGAPRSESSRSETRPPNSLSSGSGSQEPGLIADLAAAARGGAFGDSQGRNSDNAEVPVLCFTAKKPSISGNSSGYSSSRINFALQLIASDPELDSKLTLLKAGLRGEMLAKAYEAVIDVESNPSSLLLHVRIACKWKTAVHTETIKRIMRRAICERFIVDNGKIRIFDLGTALPSGCQFGSGTRWLQHSPARGAAYTMPMEKFVLELGNEVRAQEAQLLGCATPAQYMADAKAKQLLLSNLLDVLRWRCPQVPNTSCFVFQTPKEPALQDAGRAGSIDSAIPAPAQSLPSTRSPTVTDISSSDGRASNPCRNLSFSSIGLQSAGGTEVPPGKATCDSGAGPAGVQRFAVISFYRCVMLTGPFDCSCWIWPGAQTD